jgi:hypothetical protein
MSNIFVDNLSPTNFKLLSQVQGNLIIVVSFFKFIISIRRHGDYLHLSPQNLAMSVPVTQSQTMTNLNVK